jgi:hypothetical protein
MWKQKIYNWSKSIRKYLFAVRLKLQRNINQRDMRRLTPIQRWESYDFQRLQLPGSKIYEVEIDKWLTKHSAMKLKLITTPNTAQPKTIMTKNKASLKRQTVRLRMRMSQITDSQQLFLYWFPKVIAIFSLIFVATCNTVRPY